MICLLQNHEVGSQRYDTQRVRNYIREKQCMWFLIHALNSVDLYVYSLLPEAGIYGRDK